jgi:signal recognition particle receptor subunit beta
MVFFNWATMQMAAKIVYYGPGLCGKTSNLSYIYAKTTPNSRGEMVSLETESDRTLFFDLLPIEVGTIGGFKTRLQLYTVPGQVFYNTTRKLVLKGVDGLVFVADSQRPMREANIESFTSLVENIEDLGLDMADLPLVLQFNKRDLKNILTVDELNSDLNAKAWYPHHEASAINGVGVFETLKEITKLTLKKLRKRMASSQPGGVSPASVPVRPAMAPQRPESISAASLARAAEEGVVSNADSGVSTPAPAAVAPPAPASAPYGSGSDVFSTPSDTPDAPQAPPGGGPLDGAGEASTEDGLDEAFAASAADAPAFPEDTDGVEFDAEGIHAEFSAAVETEAEPWEATEPEAAGFGNEAAPQPEIDPVIDVDFDKHADDEPVIAPPPVKRVHVSNQLDILAELEGLRSGSFPGGSTAQRRSPTSEIDIDSLISGAMGGAKEIRRRIQRELGPEVFRELRGIEVAVRVKNAGGELIHTLEPVLLEVDDIGTLTKLSLRFAIDLDQSK